MQVKPRATSVPNFNSLSLQTNFLWSKEENLPIQIVSRLSEVKYAWQQLLDQLMDFKSLDVEQQGKTSATNGPKFNRLSQQTNHLLLRNKTRIGIKTTIKKSICFAITLRLINGFQVCKCEMQVQPCATSVLISTRYRYKQIIYDRRKRTYLFKLYQDLG